MPLDVEQELNPAYSPDGKTIAFCGFRGNQPDIFTYDIASGAVTNLTNDHFFDGAPVFSPDGKWLIYSSVVNGYAKLFKLNLANPAERYQLTTGDWNDIDAWFSPGRQAHLLRLRQADRPQYREGRADPRKPRTRPSRPATNRRSPDPTNFAAYNIYSLNLESGDLLQYTDVVGGCFTPVVFTGTNNRERMVFASYYKGHWRLFSTPTDKPLHAAEKTSLPTAPLQAQDRKAFEPPVEVTIDPEKIEKPHGFKLFIDDVDVNAGVSSDQLFIFALGDLHERHARRPPLHRRARFGLVVLEFRFPLLRSAATLELGPAGVRQSIVLQRQPRRPVIDNAAARFTARPARSASSAIPSIAITVSTSAPATRVGRSPIPSPTIRLPASTRSPNTATSSPW